jgi:hypothetical protein
VPELKRVWASIAPQVHRQHSVGFPTLRDGEKILLLCFRSAYSASLWLMLQSNGIKPMDYEELFLAQTGKKLPESFFDFELEPVEFSSETERKFLNEKDSVIIRRSVDMSDVDYEMLEHRYALSEHEKWCGQCFLCRGNGLILAIKENETPVLSSGRIQPMYQLSCIHHYFSYIREKGNQGRRPKEKQNWK